MAGYQSVDQGDQVNDDDNIPIAAAVLIDEEQQPEQLLQQQSSSSSSQQRTSNCLCPVTTSSSNDTNNNNNNTNDITFTRYPMVLEECPHCHVESRTRTTTQPSCVTWTVTIILLLIFWPICWIPLVSDRMKETSHFCVHCGTFLGKLDAFEDCCVKHRE